MKFAKPSYDEIRANSLVLFESIRASGWSPDVNVCVGRGGLFVLRCLQDFYAVGTVKIPYAVPAVERYNGINSTGKIKIHGLHRESVKGKKVLVVDDVSDQGDSLKAMVSLIRRNGAADVRTATVHFKPWSKLRPDYFVVETDSWIIYPWELYESIRLIVQKEAGKPAREVHRVLTEDAMITKEEYLAFCTLAAHSPQTNPAELETIEEVCRLFKRKR